MINDLPDLPEIKNIFEENKNDAYNLSDEELIEDEIYIYICKEQYKWISVAFIDVAPSNIGLHVLLPIDIEFQPADMDNVRVKFERKHKNENIVLKEVPALIRWQERDTISGRMKIGIHFHGETKNDATVIEILDKLKAKKK